ncbi:MAG: DUF871 domain-containing protein [Oscillospiraceae bacterium]|nr:DUF871 domain-containing protein [Oscillospiraceae bacterium]
MPNSLGFSLYLSTFADQWPTLVGWTGTGAPVFLSLHISEEFNETYCRRAEEVCRTLASHGFRVIADVSRKTLHQFGCADLVELAQSLQLWALRIDYGFGLEEILAMAEKMPIVLNASTVTADEARIIGARGREVFAMHNFYPRPETGLDEDDLLERTKALQAAGLKVLAFIPGDAQLRGPVYEGLPTLEAHREVLPSAAFADLAVRYGLDGIFLGDPGLSEKEQSRIQRFCRENVLSVPAVMDPEYEDLYDRVFTCRVDSPRRLIRFLESREYSCKGTVVSPENCITRLRGTITIDNEYYGRYTGEIQMIRTDLKEDRRVNVIGQVCKDAMLLMDCIGGGQKFALVRP